MKAESAERWGRFLAHCERARAKPTFDAEERNPKIRIAEQLRDALVMAREGGQWLPAVRAAFQDGLFVNLTVRAHRDWFKAWAAADPESLRGALADVLDEDTDAEGRFASFARAAGDADAKGTVKAPPGAVLALGSLCTFATDPTSLPLVRPWHFEKLEQILGDESQAPPFEAAAYPQHLSFARRLRSRMEESGLGVRDMIDVQSLIFIAAGEHAFWAGSRLYAIGVRPPPEPRAESHDEGSDAKLYLSVCAVYRNEAPYLREWIEFHRLAGVQHFFLYDNLSTDAHREMLAPYVENGIVTVRDWKVASLDQRDTYDHCLKEDGARSRWIAFIDLDEFLFSPSGGPLPEVLTEYEQWPGVGVNWAVFGTSGHSTKPPGLVIENYFTRVDAPANRFIKSIVDPSRVTRCASAHHFTYQSLLTMDENHYPIHDLRSKSVSFSRLRINHYVTRSEAEARTKLSGWEGWKYGRRWRSSKLEDEYPQELDRTITAHVPAVREALARTAAQEESGRLRRQPKQHN